MMLLAENDALVRCRMAGCKVMMLVVFATNMMIALVSLFDRLCQQPV